jgi:thioredoxin-like negative regulator of GroEL
MKPLKINLLSYEAILGKTFERPALFVFGAVWDYESRRMFNHLDKVSERFGDRLCTGMVDLDFVPDIFSENRVYDIPAAIVFEDGKELKRIEKLTSPNQIDELADYLFGIMPYEK